MSVLVCSALKAEPVSMPIVFRVPLFEQDFRFLEVSMQPESELLDGSFVVRQRWDQNFDRNGQNQSKVPDSQALYDRLR